MCLMSHLLIFLASLVLGTLISIPLGPVGVICARRALVSGKKWAILSASGSMFSDIFYASIVVFNLEILIHFFQKFEIVFYLFGIIFLFFLGLKSLKVRSVKNMKLYPKFLEPFIIFFINLSNPSIILSFSVLFLSLSVQRFLHNFLDRILFVLGIGIGSLVWCFFLSQIVLLLKKKIDRDIMVLLYKFSGVLLLIFASLLFLSLMYDLLLRFVW